MNVSEVIAQLQKCPPDTIVHVCAYSQLEAVTALTVEILDGEQIVVVE